MSKVNDAGRIGKPDSSCLTAALSYLELGWSAIPLCPPDHGNVSDSHRRQCKKPGKAPLIAGWQEKRLSEADLRRHWKKTPAANIGIALGPISGLCALDIDGPAGLRLFEQLARSHRTPNPDDTLGFHTGGGGARLLYALPEGADPPQHVWTIEGQEVLRFQAKGGQTVMPPSVHASGRLYEWCEGSDPEEMAAALCPQWLLDLVEQLHAERERGTTRRGEALTPPPSAARIISGGSVVEAARRLNTDVIERARAYLATMEAPDTSPEHPMDASTQILKAASALVGLSIPDDDAVFLLGEWDTNRCFKDKEYRRKLSEARKTGYVREGSLLDTPRRNEPAPFRVITEASSPATPPPPAAPTIERPERRLELVSADSLIMRPNKWLVPDFIVRGGLTVIAGDGGFGKSSLTVHLAANLSNGSPCFGLRYDTDGPARTLLVGCEDSPAATVLPRLAAAEAVLERIFFVGDVKVGDSDSCPFTLSPSSINALEERIRELGDVACVVIDPVSAFLPEQIDDHKDAHTRRMLRPLAKMAERLDIAIVLVKHLNKSDSGNGGNLVSGSRAYVNAARAAFMVGQDPTDDDEERRVLVFSKKNLTRRRKGLAFRAVALTPFEQQVVLDLPQAGSLDEAERAALREQLFRLEWLGETDVTDKDLARARRGTSAPSSDKEERINACSAWLVKFLAAGCQPSDTVASEAEAAGFNRNILFAAKKQTPGVKASNKGQFRGKWHWWIESNELLPE